METRKFKIVESDPEETDEDQERKKRIDARCHAFRSSHGIMLRSVKFVELPDMNPADATQFDMTYCVVELTPHQAVALGNRLIEMAMELGEKP